MGTLFAILVVLGFLFHLLSTFPVTYASRVAWSVWLVAAVIWAIPKLGGLG